MDQLAIARRAIEDEISALSTEITRLEKVLETLGGTDSIAPYNKYASAPASPLKAAPAAAAIAAPRRGRPPQAAAVAKGNGDVSSALELIKGAGKKGIKALSLASLIKKAGGDRPSKEELLATDKIKMSGKGGGTTYTYVG